MSRLAGLVFLLLGIGTVLYVTAQPSGPPRNLVSILADEEFRYVDANGWPDHVPGQFPNRRNPNTARPQKYHYRMPLQPVAAKELTPLGMYPFGVAVNGVPFDPGANEFWNRDRRSGWQYEALSGHIDLGMDEHHAHVQPDGAYHYHGLPTGLLLRLRTDPPTMTLLGYAADGFPIYGPQGPTDPNDLKSPLKRLTSSFRVKAGTRPSGPGGNYDGTFVQDWEFVAGHGDLDACNGRTGLTPEFPAGTYYYVLTSEFPFIPRAFRGTPDPSFFRHGPPGGGPPPGGGGLPKFGPPPLRF